MKNLKNKKWLLSARPVGMVGEHNFEFLEEEVEDIKEGEFLIKNLYLSFDPAQRGWMEDRKSYVPPVGIGEVMRAGSVGQESNQITLGTKKEILFKEPLVGKSTLYQMEKEF